MNGFSFDEIDEKELARPLEKVVVTKDFIYLITPRMKIPYINSEIKVPIFAFVELKWNYSTPKVLRIIKMTEEDIEKNGLGEMIIKNDLLYVHLKPFKTMKKLIYHQAYGVIDDPRRIADSSQVPAVCIKFPIYDRYVVYEITENLSQDKKTLKETEAAGIIRELFESKVIANAIRREDSALCSHIIQKLFST